MRWWRVAFDEDDEQSRAQAMELFHLIDQTYDRLQDAFKCDPTPAQVCDAMTAQGRPIRIMVDGEGCHVVVPQ